MLKKICNILSTILLLFMLIVAGLLIVPPIMGYQSLAVLSGSMEPNIGVGAIAYVAETDPAGLEVGDVITYRISGDTFVTHRIVEIDTTAQSVITKGDANDVVDGSPVAFNQIVGRVDFHVPLLGYVSIYIKESDSYENFSLKAIKPNRCENKELIVKEIENKLLSII